MPCKYKVLKRGLLSEQPTGRKNGRMTTVVPCPRSHGENRVKRKQNGSSWLWFWRQPSAAQFNSKILRWKSSNKGHQRTNLPGSCFVDNTWLIPYLEFHFHTELKFDEVWNPSSQKKFSVTANAMFVPFPCPRGLSPGCHHQVCTHCEQPWLDSWGLASALPSNIYQTLCNLVNISRL